MNMRVIAGIAKGRTLIGPKSDKIRPALDKVKQAIFNILGAIDDLRVLDVFAGTGSIGIEAISRGAFEAVFIDQDAQALKLVQRNLELCHFENQATTLKLKLPEGILRFAKYLGAASSAPTFDLIFVDPPYDKDLVNPSLRLLAQSKMLADKGFIIVEHSPRELIEEDCGWTLRDQRKYGQTLISFLKPTLVP